MGAAPAVVAEAEVQPQPARMKVVTATPTARNTLALLVRSIPEGDWLSQRVQPAAG
jgi:hypothetical protein